MEIIAHVVGKHHRLVDQIIEHFEGQVLNNLKNRFCYL